MGLEKPEAAPVAHHGLRPHSGDSHGSAAASSSCMGFCSPHASAGPVHSSMPATVFEAFYLGSVLTSQLYVLMLCAGEGLLTRLGSSSASS